MAWAAVTDHFSERLPLRAPPATCGANPRRVPTKTHPPWGFCPPADFRGLSRAPEGGTAILWIPGRGDANLWITRLGGPHHAAAMGPAPTSVAHESRSVVARAELLPGCWTACP